MLVIYMGPYDAILGFDWLKLHSPMQCDWSNKTLTFTHDGKTVTIQGLQTLPLQATPISPTQLYKATKGNDTWAFVMLQQTSEPNPDTPSTKLTNLDLQIILTKYHTVFQDPQTLPPQRSYDHSIPLIPGAIPINARPYHYSPQHKTEIETQVKQLLQSGLITQSQSLCLSGTAREEKGWDMEVLCGL